ncbi:hypothetical protein [Schumannella soli]|uniref:Uncharacterized protein n=1 Tax=Schumannella soli TaxID=2590779 RepID=A0A506Y894_9MICO|nr:hypothetical protein [Schumannella soli]TPW77720.1 hypothetical protein FJ657_03440 [Schumannella soli]
MPWLHALARDMIGAECRGRPRSDALQERAESAIVRSTDAAGADSDALTRAERVGVIVGVGLAALVTIVSGTLLALDGGTSHAVEPGSRTQDRPAHVAQVGDR